MKISLQNIAAHNNFVFNYFTVQIYTIILNYDAHNFRK